MEGRPADGGNLTSVYQALAETGRMAVSLLFAAADRTQQITRKPV